MDSSKLAVKFFVKDASGIAADAFVPIFHSWIQEHAIADHLLIDVADYKHVRNGPGTVLVAHEANFSSDSADGRLGLLYTRKQPLPGDLTERIAATFRAALAAARLLEQVPSLAGKLHFATDQAIFRINDRLAAPNTAETFEQIRPALAAFLADLYGGSVTLHQTANAEKLFEIRITARSSPSAESLLNSSILHAIILPS